MVLVLPITIFLILILVRRFFLNLGFLEVLGITIIYFSALTVFVIEFISRLNKINSFSLFVSYSLIILFISGIAIKSNAIKLSGIVLIQKIFNLKSIFPWKNSNQKVIAYSSVGLIILVLLQALIYPPTNWDSMTYHMARVSNWVGNETIEHYATHIYRQIFQPPFAEFLALQINLLTGSDILANSIQWFFWLSSLGGVLLILNELTPSKYLRVPTIILFITLPEALLQASSTQNDMVVTFFVVFGIYFILKIEKNLNFRDFIHLGLCVGLAMLTKGTGYIYFAPVLFIFSLISLKEIIKNKRPLIIVYCLLAAVVSLSINGFQYNRNYMLTGNILAISEEETGMLTNEEYNPKVFVSNTLRNLALHAGPYPINTWVTTVVNNLHDLFGIDKNNPKTTFPGTIFKGAPNFPNNEDTAPNPLHLIIIFVGISGVLRKFFLKEGNVANKKILLLIIFLQLLLFVIYLKWQPWHSRLHLPYFILLLPLAVSGFDFFNWNSILIKVVVWLLISYAFAIVIFNSSRPFIPIPYLTSPITIFDSKFKKYFSNRYYDVAEYYRVKNYINENAYREIGLILLNDNWEYPLFNDIYNSNIRPHHLKVKNISGKLETLNQNVDCIITSGIEDSTLVYNEIIYYRVFNNHELINIFEPRFKMDSH